MSIAIEARTAIDTLLQRIEPIMSFSIVGDGGDYVLVRQIKNYVDEIKAGDYNCAGYLIAEVDHLADLAYWKGYKESDELFLLEIAATEARVQLRPYQPGSWC